MREPLTRRISLALQYTLAQRAFPAEIGIVLGSGLGDFADTLKSSIVVDVSSIPHYPATGVPGHRGTILFAHAGRRAVLTFQGRPHFYESADVENVVFPVLLAHHLGVRQMIFTNAAGGVNRALQRGDLMVISDQMNLTGESLPAGVCALGGSKEAVFDPGLVEVAVEAAARLGLNLRRGVYAGVKGPSYETASEIEMVRRLGGDAVGMSTVLEASLAAALGMRVLGISCITNMATGASAGKLDHTEVTEVARSAGERFKTLLTEILQALPPLVT